MGILNFYAALLGLLYMGREYIPGMDSFLEKNE